jgi:hypothetical protein
MHSEDQRIQPNLPATSHHIRPDRPVSWPGIRLQSSWEMWRAVGRILWKFAEIYVAAFAGILTGFFFGAVVAIALVGFLWYDLALCVIVFCVAGGGLLFAFLAWKDRA